MLSVQIGICLLIFGAGCTAIGLGGLASLKLQSTETQSSTVKCKSAAWYHAEWCGPCKRMHPIITQMILEGFDIIVIDVDKDEYYNPSVTKVPTMRFFPGEHRNGIVRHEIVGFMSRAKIEDYLTNINKDQP